MRGILKHFQNLDRISTFRLNYQIIYDRLFYRSILLCPVHTIKDEIGNLLFEFIRVDIF